MMGQAGSFLLKKVEYIRFKKLKFLLLDSIQRSKSSFSKLLFCHNLYNGKAYKLTLNAGKSFMLVLLLSPEMDIFYQIISSFPTVIWTFLVALLCVYWLIAVLGLVPIDIFEFGLDSSNPSTSDPLNNANALVGLLLRLKLSEIPFTITLSVVSLVAWLFSYYSMYFAPDFLKNTLIFWPFSLLILVASGGLGFLVAAIVLRPFKKLFPKTITQSHYHLVEKIAKVRTSRVDANFGEATLIDGGAGLVLQIRASVPNEISVNDEVILLEYDPDKKIFLVGPREKSLEERVESLNSE